MSSFERWSQGESTRDIHPEFAVELDTQQQIEALDDIQERHSRALLGTAISGLALQKLGITHLNELPAPHTLAVGLRPHTLEAGDNIRYLIVSATNRHVKKYDDTTVEGQQTLSIPVAVEFNKQTLIREKGVDVKDAWLVNVLSHELEEARDSGALPNLSDDLLSIRTNTKSKE